MWIRLFWAAFLAALAPTSGWAASASASISVNIVPPSALQVVSGALYGWGYCGSSYTWTLSPPAHAGDTIVGGTLWEAPPDCSGGSPDTITLGSQQATLYPTISPRDFGQDYCCPGMTPFILFNVSGTQSTFTIASSNGGNFRPPLGLLAVVSGLSGSASVDKFRGNFTNSAGTGANALTSGPITPSQAGDFLYGFQVSVYGSHESVGTGWTAGPNSGVCSDPLCVSLPSPMQDEYILNYNSTSPIQATFGLSSSTGEYTTYIFAIKPQ
jgi:hypothetical protein